MIFNNKYFEKRKATSKLRNIMYSHEIKRIYKSINYSKKKKYELLDIGCGDGTFLDLFKKNFNKTGVEISGFARRILKKKGINCSPNIKYLGNKKFDLIIFRGSIQLIDTPFLYIKSCIKILKKNGLLIFLATPNSNSIYYRLNKTLPMIDSFSTFFLPNDRDLKRVLENFNLEVLNIEYPYLNTPYANILKDHFFFILNIFGVKKNYAFYRSLMEIYARKK